MDKFFEPCLLLDEGLIKKKNFKTLSDALLYKADYTQKLSSLEKNKLHYFRNGYEEYEPDYMLDEEETSNPGNRAKKNFYFYKTGEKVSPFILSYAVFMYGKIAFFEIDNNNGFYLIREPSKLVFSKEFNTLVYTADFFIAHDNEIIMLEKDLKEYYKNYVCFLEYEVPFYDCANFIYCEDAYGSNPLVTKIKKFMRNVGFETENRGKRKKLNETTIHLRDFVINEFRLTNKQKPLPIAHLQKRVAQEADRLFPDNPKIAEKYYWSDATIRRIISPLL